LFVIPRSDCVVCVRGARRISGNLAGRRGLVQANYWPKPVGITRKKPPTHPNPLAAVELDESNWRDPEPVAQASGRCDTHKLCRSPCVGLSLPYTSFHTAIYKNNVTGVSGTVKDVLSCYQWVHRLTVAGNNLDRNSAAFW
jgi:hypothetical protein